ncbi:YraN family protein [Acetobacterium carbinolicum]|jgi:putative endonuclease|uniref:YraN family protein n=1 Tax=Acetobacterium TaxID=33951 RepID=UPI000DBEADE9|nr:MULTISPECIES: YraN family protein [unclassified Acetobacterium]AWW25414.1 YraN family protein [Acetobacterium sp. KB-1]MDZ5723928.1 YraN family protein [Acetobacterium sp. K1/6]
MKTHNLKKGKAGEALAVTFLENINHRICQMNYKKPSGEIDLITQDGDTLVFVEVKYRKNLDYGYPREAVNRAKQKRIAKTALWYLKEKQLDDVSVRFDVIEIYYGLDGEQVINHFENAFSF